MGTKSESISDILDWIQNYAEINHYAKRIIVGSEGGLALRLFDDNIPGTNKPFPTQFYVTNPLERDDINIYFNHIEHYLDNAHNLARHHSFNTKRIQNDPKKDTTLILPWSYRRGTFYEAGIGTPEIKDFEELQRFKNMIAMEKDVLSESYNDVARRALWFT